MTKTPLFPITLFAAILIFLLISGCGHGGSSSANQPPSLVSFTVSPASRSIPLGVTRQYAVTGTYSDGSRKAISSSSVAWGSTNAGIVSINSSGLATSKSKGTTTISASTGGITVSIDLQVTPADIFTDWSTSGTPAGVALDASGNVFVPVFSNNSNLIREYTGQGSLIATGAASITSNAAGIALDSTSGNVYVTDYANNRLNIYNPLGTLVTFLSIPSPAGVAVDPSGNIYVTDAGNNLVHKFDSSLNEVQTSKWPASTSGIPSGVAVDSSNNVYVADFSKSMIRVYGSDGTPATSWTINGTPSGVAVDPTGPKVYVIDTYNYLLHEYDTSGKESNGPWSTTGWPNGIAVDASGYVYVADSTNNRVRICPPQ